MGNPTIRTRTVSSAAVLAALAAVIGCEAEDAELSKLKDPTAVQDFLTAEDFETVAVDAESLCLQGQATLAFDKPGKTMGYQLAALEGDTLHAHLSGNGDIDTILLLYGPADDAGYYGQFPILADDDSGEGLLSDLGAYTFKTTGAYMLVATTYGGGSKGKVKLHVTLNGGDGCTPDKPKPPKPGDKPVCCALANGFEEVTAKECKQSGGNAVPFALCSLPDPEPGEPLCCIWPSDSGALQAAWVPEGECWAMNGQPALAEVCEQPQETVCCVFAINSPQGQAELPLEVCIAEGGQPAPPEYCGGGEPLTCCLVIGPNGQQDAGFVTVPICLEQGGQPAPSEFCGERGGEVLCCAIDPGQPPSLLPAEICYQNNGWPLPPAECGGDNQSQCCVFVDPNGNPAFVFAPVDACLAEGGQPAPNELCEQVEQGVCCAFVAADGSLQLGIAPVEVCLVEGGQVAPMELCSEPPQEVCCTFGNAGPAVTIPAEVCELEGGAIVPLEQCAGDAPVCCIFPDNWGAQALPFPKQLCMEQGGQPAPIEVCEQPPTGLVCCAVQDPAIGAGTVITSAEECKAINGVLAPDSQCGGEPQAICCLFFTDAAIPAAAPMGEEQCVQQGGEVSPIETCEQLWEQVCCAIPNGLGAAQPPVWVHPQECEAIGGMFLEPFYCEPSPPPQPVCCLFVDAAGNTWEKGLESLEACLAQQGQPTPEEECGPNEPDALCCLVLDPAGVPQAWPAPPSECGQLGGIPAPLELCEQTDTVCCYLPDPSGAAGKTLLEANVCILGGGQPAPAEQCKESPEEPVCCQFFAPSGKETKAIAPANECAQVGGDILPIEECQNTPPQKVCCVVPNQGTAGVALYYSDPATCGQKGGLAKPAELCLNSGGLSECCAKGAKVSYVPFGTCQPSGGKLAAWQQCL
jgi:hypothetical protein